MMMFQPVAFGYNYGVKSASIVKKFVFSKPLLRVELAQFLCKQSLVVKFPTFYNNKRSLFYKNANSFVGPYKHSLIKTTNLRFLSDEDSNWENLLLSDKKNNIKAIPVKRENIFTIPNLISCLRIAVSPYIGYLIVHQNFTAALAITFLAAISDVADGYIARRWPSQQSALGSALDPLADKVLISVLALSLTYVHIIPVMLTTLFIGRDVLLIGAVFYLRYKTCPPPVTLKRYFDPTLVNAKLSPTKISKMNTVLQIAVIWSSVASPVFGFADHILLKSLWCLSAVTTIWSGLSYIKRKDTVHILKDNEKL